MIAARLHRAFARAARACLAAGALLALSAPGDALQAQRAAPAPVALRAVEVDARGVLRWTDDHREIALFGVNYTAPFAYAYRALGYLGLDRKAAIDMDVAHLARLGLQAYRIHVWDREISDRQGNILENDHLDLFDYLIARLEERGIHLVLTPIVWGGAGYPEPDPPTPGFSNAYTKGGMTVDTTARRIQRAYLQQFVQHRNRYTGRAYRDDPGIVAIELFNEPVDPPSPAETTRFIDALADAARQAGWRKPILYNVAQSWSPEHAPAVCAARIQGVTFQWYPTGLVRSGDVRTNMLPNVDRYTIPWQEAPNCLGKARLVYEFDQADVMGSYLYPAIARSFRAAGMQWAAQFAYDPGAIAYANTEYQTHYLNLLYTPRKAISFLIAGEAFRRLPRDGSWGAYPADTVFGPFRVSYAEDLSEMNAPEAFYYSGDTRTRPAEPRALVHVAGTGSSPVVEYEGTGAYFLDRLEPGVWRLELYPDALLLRDPFPRHTVRDEVTRLIWRDWPMTVRLPDLGDAFSATAVDGGHRFTATASGGRIMLGPGVYVLRRAGVGGGRWRDPAVRVGAPALGEFRVPTRPQPRATEVVHRPALALSAGDAYVVEVTVVSALPPDSALLAWRQAGAAGFQRLPLRRVRGYRYQATIPGTPMLPGTLEYSVRLVEAGRANSFPGATPGTAGADSLWRVPIVAASAPLVLFDAARDQGRAILPHPFERVRHATAFVAYESAGAPREVLRAEVQSLAPPPQAFAVRAFLGEEGRARLEASAAGRNRAASSEEGRSRLDSSGLYATLRVRARSTGAPDSVRVALVERGGAAWGAVVPLAPEWREITVPLTMLRRVPLALLPRPYPQFLPYWLSAGDGGAGGALRVSELDGIQVSVSGDLYDEAARARPHGFELERIQLERTP